MRAMPSTPTRMFCGETSRCTRSSGCAVVVVQLVRGVQAGERVEQDAQRDRPRARARRRAGGARDDARERVALDVLHHQVVAVLARRRPRGWARRAGDGCRAARRASSRNISTNSCSLGEVRVQPLDRDEALEAARRRRAARGRRSPCRRRRSRRSARSDRRAGGPRRDRRAWHPPGCLRTFRRLERPPPSSDAHGAPPRRAVPLGRFRLASRSFRRSSP